MFHRGQPSPCRPARASGSSARGPAQVTFPGVGRILLWAGPSPGRRHLAGVTMRGSTQVTHGNTGPPPGLAGGGLWETLSSHSAGRPPKPWTASIAQIPAFIRPPGGRSPRSVLLKSCGLGFCPRLQEKV